MKDSRQGLVQRITNETRIMVDFTIDGEGRSEVRSGVPFLDHMLALFTVHGLFDLKIEAEGDLEVDAHHTVEDTGICLGGAFARAIGDRKGIRRYGHAVIPMDEACASVTLDLSNRPYLVYDVPALTDRVGDFETELVPEFLRAFCQHGGVTLHAHGLYGDNTHHILEAIFKAWGRALDKATQYDERRSGIPSSKGTL